MRLYVLKKKKKRKKTSKEKKNPPNPSYITQRFLGEKASYSRRLLLFCNSPDDSGQSRCVCPFPREGDWVRRCSAGDGDAAPWWLSQGWNRANPRKLFFLLLPGSSRKCIGKVTQNLAIMQTDDSRAFQRPPGTPPHRPPRTLFSLQWQVLSFLVSESLRPLTIIEDF